MSEQTLSLDSLNEQIDRIARFVAEEIFRIDSEIGELREQVKALADTVREQAEADTGVLEGVEELRMAVANLACRGGNGGLGTARTATQPLDPSQFKYLKFGPSANKQPE